MRGIDIYQGDGNPLKAVPAKAYKESDFVIIKATQGTSYSKTSYFTSMIKKALKDDKLCGAYHYAGGKDPIKEADYFLSIVKPYIGEIILCLDWESMQNVSWGSKTWCTKFINHVKEKTGITCFLYSGTDGCKQNLSLVDKVPLWFAGYPKNENSWTVPKFIYNITPWKYTIWQFTSGKEKCDRNVTNLTEAQWIAYAKGKPIPKNDVKTSYTGKLPKLPSRGYFKFGDGMITLRNEKEQIRLVQKVLNWAIGSGLVIDGKYGLKTQIAVEKLQKKYKLPVNGCFGNKCLTVIKNMKK